MTATSRLPAGSWTANPAAGGNAPDPLHEAVAIAREWAGEGLVALLLSGSHATAEAVWLEHGDRRVTLSDLDLYAVLEDGAACRAAAARASRGRAAATARLREAGIEAPLEIGFLTADGLSRMPAKPGTIELARHGRVVAGDAAVLSRVPRWSPRDVAAEEVALLLENRGFELLLAWPLLESPDPLERARGRHGTLKAVADLASVLALRAGEFPDGTAARIAWVRERAAPAAGPQPAPGRIGVPAELDGLWSSCLAWRRGEAGMLDPGEAVAEWRRAVRGWCGVWSVCFTGPERDPWDRARRSAARAPLPRRLWRGLVAAGASAPARRLRLALAGTPQHRVNASAAVLLLCAAEAAAVPALPAGALRALRALGVVGTGSWDEARREVVRRWDGLVLGGRRGTDTR